ncbi:MAG: hypothetical protein ABI592_09570 [Acidobacteriota bacterium]
MSSPSDSAGPICPRCGRRIAAWRLEHCVYCGAVFPPDFRVGYKEPESLKWVDRPPIPNDAARQLEMLRVVELDRTRKKSPASVFGLLSVPIFAALFFFLYRILSRYSASSAVLVLIAGGGFLAYLVWNFLKPSS